MKILVINAGSSSLKYQFINSDDEKVLAKGLVEKIGLADSVLTHKVNGKSYVFNKTLSNHTDAFKFVFEKLLDSECGVISDLSEIDAIGHRVLHGGEIYKTPVLISDADIAQLKKLIPLGPLHMPANISGIESCMALMPNTPNVALFDTAFHSSMPDYAYLYATPYEWYEKFGVRKYGFHGMSHEFIAQEVARIEGRDDLKIINCHIGNGASVCAIKNGKCIDTSMGLTPLGGFPMVTRSGDLDPAVLGFIMKKENLTIDEMMTMLNKKSGLLGITGKTGDIRDLKELEKQGDKMASLALDMFAYRVKKYIGSYMAVLGHVDAIIFEGGIGEHNPDVISRCVSGLEELGIVFDNSHNDNEQYEGKISMPESKIQMYVIPTNEELEIAEETMELVK